MLPFKQLISFDRKARTPVYLQIVQQVIHLIQHGKLLSGTRLPGSRMLSQDLAVHRNTVIRAYEELEALGWIEIRANVGAFVAHKLPLVKPNSWAGHDKGIASESDFSFYPFPHLEAPLGDSTLIAFDDGLPDVRLAPIDELARSYASNLRSMARRKKLGYTEALGNLSLRRLLATMLNETRGMNVTEDHILITRGTIMAMHLALASIIRPGDCFAVGESNYQTANMLIQHMGGKLIHIPVDEGGIDTESLEEVCKRTPIRGIYLTPHHHHPTTVSLSPERRIQLIELAHAYNFVMLEDDYDYDFHYDNNPILPLASGNHQGRVLYVGSFTKVLAPAFRVGFLVANPNLIVELSKLRRVMDRQGDEVLEKSFAELMENGTIRRSLRKAWKHYKERRDLCCELFSELLGAYLQFQKPTGGMAIWAHFAPDIDLCKLRKRASEKGLYLADGSKYPIHQKQENAIRMGFASMNAGELEQAMEILQHQLKK